MTESARAAEIRAALMPKILPRWEHQEETLRFALKNPIVFDTSDPGTGKTRGHTDTFQERLNKGESEQALIICPKSLIQSAWGDDIKKFTPNLMYSTAYAENRTEAFDTKVPVHITNTDAVRWLVKKTPSWFKRRFGSHATLIVDESTAFKHRGSARSKALKKIAKHFEFRTLLTGTPFTQTVTNIWHQILILDRGKRLGTAFTWFRNEVQNAQPDVGGFIKWEDKEGIEGVVALLIKDISIRHQFEDVMDVPENYSRTIEFDLSAKNLRIYREMENEAFLEMEKGNVTAVNAAVLYGKLLQIASGSVYGVDEGRGRHAHLIDKARYELVTDLVEERTHSIVFYNWHHQRDTLIQNAKKRNLNYAILDGSVPNNERAKIVRAFQDGAYRALYLSPQTGAHGLTLTKGVASIWASPRSEPDFIKQGVHRIYRGGQTQKTENIMVSARDTIEPLVYSRLNHRYKKMVTLLDLLNERREQSQ